MTNWFASMRVTWIPSIIWTTSISSGHRYSSLTFNLSLIIFAVLRLVSSSLFLSTQTYDTEQ